MWCLKPRIRSKRVMRLAWSLALFFLCRAICTCTAVATSNTSHFSDTDELDPIVTFNIENFKQGAVKTVPLQFRYTVEARSYEGFTRQYAKARFCVEIDGGVWSHCEQLFGYDIQCHDLAEGSHTAIMYIMDGDGRGRIHDTNPVNFTLISDDAYELYIESLVEQQHALHHFPQDENILEWADRQAVWVDPHTTEKTTPPSFLSDSNGLMVVIGIKTAVLTNFPRRQAIRETWASKTSLPPDVKVVFLGCTPDTASISNARDRRRFEEAVNLERAIYGDLLTEELECDDAYHKLADKVKAYFEFAAAEFPHAKFVALADDDIYLRVDSLAAYLREKNPSRQYLGDVWRTRLKTKEHPLRDSTLPNYLSFDVYPLHEYPPYPIGSCYVVSMDSARFIAKNRWRLHSLSGVEDASTAFWLLSTQVHQQLAPAFFTLKLEVCRDNAISMAEFAPLGIRHAHDNLLHKRSLCHGFDRSLWHWSPRNSASTILSRMPQTESTYQKGKSQLQLDAFAHDGSEMTVTVSTTEQAGIKLTHVPRDGGLEAISSHICNRIQQLNNELIDLPNCLEAVARLNI